MKTLFRLLSFAPPLIPIALRYFTLVLFGVVFSVLNISLLIPVLDTIFSNTDVEPITALPAFSLSLGYFRDYFYYYFYQFQINYGPMGALQFTCAIMLIATLLANIFKYVAQRTITRMQSFVIRNLREALFNKLMQLHIGYFYKTKKGHLLSLVSNDINEIQNVAGNSLQIIFRDPFFIIAYAAMLFYLSPQLTLFSLLVLPVAVFIISRLAKLLKRHASQSQTLLSNLLGLMNEAASGIRVIKVFSAEKYIGKKFEEQNNAQRLVFKRMWNRSDMASPLSEVLGIAAVAFIVLYGGKLILSGAPNALSGSEFVTFIIMFSQILVPAKSLAQATTNFQRGLVSADRVFNVLDADIEIKEKKNAVVLPPFQESIQLENISFAYNVDRIIKEVNLTIQKGQTIALVGQSGAGKTTLVNLIPRFYDVNKGRILIDGIDVRDYTLSSIYAQMSMVTQEQMLFNDTVYNNIVFGMENVNEEDVINAAKTANAHEFIMQLEDGYQTNIGDQGNRLSGGQKQRMTIARAVLKNPPILILDEATSALDTESERLVQDALIKLMKNRTSIVIAHRLSTIRHADKIVVMDKGEIVETGTHTELIAANGVYKRLTELQTFTQE
jgi:subfamily B ATP-binding cassette protein MsbA